MTRFATAARWLAIAIAVAAMIDPELSVPRLTRPVVRVIATVPHDPRAFEAQLRRAGFVIDPTQEEAARLLIADHAASASGSPLPASSFPLPGSSAQARERAAHTIWALNAAPAAPNLRIARAVGPSVRFPGQAIEIRVELHADGVPGRTSEIVLEDRGIPVATLRRDWKEPRERWEASLQYLPPGAAAARLRVRASAAAGETSLADNRADIAVPATRGPVRILVVEAAVTWPAMFVRRALEGEPAFDVSAVQRAAKSVATRAGGPPATLTRGALSAFEVVVIGGPDSLGAGDLDGLRWFIEERGGLVLFIPDQRPSGRYLELIGIPSATPRILESPSRLQHGLHASDMLIPAVLPPSATPLVSDGEGNPVIFSIRRGAGAIVFSGALDAWRYRDDAYAQFWREVISSHAAAVPPPIELRLHPAIAAPGQPVRISVLLRRGDIAGADVLALPNLSARAVAPGGEVDDPIRLWPTVEPGVYEGEWRARTAGPYSISVTAVDPPSRLRRFGETSAALVVAADAVHGSDADPESLAIVTSASGGQVFPIDQAPALVDAMESRHSPRTSMTPSHPMRSPWWLIPFAGLLCAEWAVRRKRGLP
jgi:hypothetical protein